ncbi:MAG TPA: hypothetical protein VJ691_06855 [Vicinamibacterales bacterium]|nr:hypothetical protein [Vicinamibacterales bacterium]
MKLIASLCTAIAISAVALVWSAPANAWADSQTQTPVEITYIGCLRAWKPATDVTRMPEGTGRYVLTPIASTPTVTNDLPTYLLVPSLAVNFPAHLDDKVEVVGTVQAAPVRPTFVGSLSGLTPRPEERLDTFSMPRLTVRTLKKISDACPS